MRHPASRVDSVSTEQAACHMPAGRTGVGLQAGLRSNSRAGCRAAMVGRDRSETHHAEWQPLPKVRCPCDWGRKGSRLPALRTVRAVFPHTALQLVVSSSGLACQGMGFWTPLPSAANMRSVHTRACAGGRCRLPVSVRCLVVADTVIRGSLPAALPGSGFHASTFLPRFPVRGLCCPACYRVRRSPFQEAVCVPGLPPGFPAGPQDRFHDGEPVTCSTIKALTAAPLHRQRSSPCLSRMNFSPFRPQPLDAPTHRFIRHASVSDGFQASPYARWLAATSRRIGFVSYGLVIHFRLLSTLLHRSTVTFNFGVMAYSDTDLHRTVHAPSQAHVQCAALRLHPTRECGLRPCPTKSAKW